MALTWTPKAPGDVYRYTWTPALADGDSIASYSVTPTGAIIDADRVDGNAIILFISGGTAGTTASFYFDVLTADSETLTETVYLPIIDTTSGVTVRSICEFALRKVYGKDETPEASAVADAVERLEDMLRDWDGKGAVVGAPYPLTESTVLRMRPAFVSAIKNNLTVQIADLYDLPISPVVANNALRGLQQVRIANLPQSYTEADYF